MKNSRGFTLLELIVTLGISSVVLTGLAVEFATLTKYSRDIEIKGEVRDTLRSVLDMIASDIRNAAAGMPLGQDNFTVSDAALGDAPLAVLTSSNSTAVHLRLNETGESTSLTADFDPTAMVTELTISSSAGFAVGDTIYSSELSSGGQNGLKADIKSIPNNTTLEIENIALPTGATLIAAGSQVSKVSDVTIQDDATNDYIVRTNNSGVAILAPDSQVTFSYLDAALNSLSDPLDATEIENQLAVIRVNVQITSQRSLSTGSKFQLSSSLDVVLRNLMIGG